MAGLILPQRFTRQPQVAVHIDWSNPLSNGLKFLWIGSRPTIELVSGSTQTGFNGNDPARSFGVGGLGLRGTITPPTGKYFKTPQVGTAYSVWSIVIDDVQGVSRHPFDSDAITGGFRIFQLSYDASNAVNFIPFDNSGNPRFPGAPAGTPSSTGLSMICGTVDAAQNALAWLNGVAGSSNAMPTVRGINSTDTICVGNIQANAGSFSTNPFPGQVLACGIHNRAITAYEQQQILANVWQLLAPAPRKLFAATATGITGTLATTDGADTLAASGLLSIFGTLATTDGADTLASSGSLTATGTSSTTDGADTLATTASVFINGTSSTTDGADTLAASGSLAATGTLAKTDGADTLAASGSLNANGTLAKTDGADTLSGSASLNANGTLATTDGADTLAGSASLTATGTLAVTDGADTLAGSGSIAGVISGTLATTDGADTLAAAAFLTSIGTLAVTDGPDSLAASAFLTALGTLATTDGADTLAGAGSIGNTANGTLATTDGADTLAASGGLSSAGSLAATDGPDVPTIASLIAASAALNATDGADALAASAAVQGVITGALNAIDGPDRLAAQAFVPLVGSLNRTDGPDVCLAFASNGVVVLPIACAHIDFQAALAATITFAAMTAAVTFEECDE